MNHSLVVQMRNTEKAENRGFRTSTRTSSNAAREEFKQAMLVKTANDKDKDSLICKSWNSKISKNTTSTKGGQEAGPSARDRGHGMGYDLRRVAITSLPERAAILRLLAS